jgi:hypothetical protein
MSFPRKTAVTAAFSLALLACRETPERGEPANAVAQPVQPAPLPVAEPPLDREALLLAAMRAASAHAAGSDDTAVQRGLNGKRFEMLIRFGCPGSGSAADAPFRSSYDPAERRLVLRAAPDVESDDLALAGIAGDEVEALEGFWVPRPWLLTVACPAPVPERDQADGEDAAATAAEKPERRLAMAQFFTATDPRTRRRDHRPYQYTGRLAEGEQPSEAGYDLVVSGRLRRLASGKVVSCTGTGLTAAPTCVISMIVDHVSMKRGDTGAVLAEWGAV